MLRFILITIFLISFLVLSIPLMIIEWITGKVNINARHRSSMKVVQWAFRTIIFISGTRITVEGKDHIPLDTAVVYVGNHNSFFDILISFITFPKPTGFIAKKEMLKAPLLNIWMILINCLFIDRKNIKEGLKTILKGIEYLKNGISICVFPEGTRSKDGKMQPFKEGSMKLAIKSDCPVIPMALTHTSDIFERQFPKIRKTHVTISFGEPIWISDLSKDDLKKLGSITQTKIQEMLDSSIENAGI